MVLVHRYLFKDTHMHLHEHVHMCIEVHIQTYGACAQEYTQTYMHSFTQTPTHVHTLKDTHAHVHRRQVPSTVSVACPATMSYSYPANSSQVTLQRASSSIPTISLQNTKKTPQALLYMCSVHTHAPVCMCTQTSEFGPECQLLITHSLALLKIPTTKYKGINRISLL